MLLELMATFSLDVMHCDALSPTLIGCYSLACSPADQPVSRIDACTAQQLKVQSCMQVRQFVSGYSDAPPSTVGSVLVQDVSTVEGSTQQWTAQQCTSEPIPDDTIEQLIQEGTVFSCAGAWYTTCILSCLFYSQSPRSGSWHSLTHGCLTLLCLPVQQEPFGLIFKASKLPRTILCTMTCLC